MCSIYAPPAISHSDTHSSVTHRTPPLTSATAAWMLAHIPQAVGTARHLACSELSSWGVGQDTVELALLAVSELVTNAVEHALPPVVLKLHRQRGGDVLRIEVSDGGCSPRSAAWARTGTSDEHGRGNEIINAIATAHGIYPGNGRTVWWAELSLAS
jgi:hypothetical protein